MTDEMEQAERYAKEVLSKYNKKSYQSFELETSDYYSDDPLELINLARLFLYLLEVYYERP